MFGVAFIDIGNLITLKSALNQTIHSFNFLTRNDSPIHEVVLIVVVQWLLHGRFRVRFPSDWLLHHGGNRGRHSANHNLLPDMHLRVPVLRVKHFVTEGLFKMSGRYLVKL